MGQKKNLALAIRSRRSFLKTGLGTLSILLTQKAPLALVKKRRKLRVMGTHVTLQEDLRLAAEKELGIELTFSPKGSSEVLQNAISDPSSFDIFEQWSNSLRVLWRAGAIQPIDKRRITKWSEVNDLTKIGKLTTTANIGQGDAPNKILYTQKDGTLSNKETHHISFLPYVHNVDSFGYDTRFIKQGTPYKTESWAWLLDEAYAGKAALVNDPTIGLFDAVLAVEAKGLYKFKDKGNLSKKEIDDLFKILLKYRRKGHFRGVWNSVPQSIDFMKKENVVIESMFSPAANTLRGQGIPCVYSAPKEGYRAWHGIMCLSSKASKEATEAAYAYMNWWLSGWPGAFIARQGYYISTPSLSKPLLSTPEWDYWYEGKEATEDLKNTQGKLSVKKGEVRNGGSYHNRFSKVAVWNTVMDNYEYTLSKWSEFVLAG